MVEGREGRKRVALERVGLPSVLSPIILSSRVSLTNVARSSNPSPIQHDQGRSAIEGVATNPLVYTVQFTIIIVLRSPLDMRREPRFEPLRVSDRPCSAVGPSAEEHPVLF